MDKKVKMNFNTRQDLSKPISTSGLRACPEELLNTEAPETAIDTIRNMKNAVSLPEMLSIREAVERTNLSYQYLRYLCIQNKVKHIRCGNKYKINSFSLAEYLNNPEEII